MTTQHHELTTVSMNVAIPGVVYDQCLDPRASGAPEEMALPVPTLKRVGKGYRYTYEGLTVEQVREMAEHMINLGGLFLANSDPETEGRERGWYRTMVRTGEALLEQTGPAEPEPESKEAG